MKKLKKVNSAEQAGFFFELMDRTSLMMDFSYMYAVNITLSFRMNRTFLPNLRECPCR